MYNELPWKWLWSLLVNTWPQTLFQPTRPVKGRHLLWIAPLNWQLLCLSVSRWPYLLAIHLVRHSYIAKMKKKVTWHHLKHSTRLFIIKFSKGLETFGFLILFSHYSCFANADTISCTFFFFFFQNPLPNNSLQKIICLSLHFLYVMEQYRGNMKKIHSANTIWRLS